MSAEVDAEAISNDPRTAGGVDPSYQPYHDIQPPANTASNPTPPMDPAANTAEEEDQIQPPKDFTEHFPSRLPVPPFIHVQGVPNFRDMGGYACPPPPSITTPDPAKAYMVRKNLLFRCAHPTQLTQHGAATLRNLGITNIYDLRSATEIEKLAHTPPATPTETQTRESTTSNANTTNTTNTNNTNKFNQPEALDTSNGYIVIPGITRDFTPVYAREDYSPVALARKLQWYTSANLPDKNYSEGFVNAYRDIATYGASGGAYATILRQTIRSAENMARNPGMGRRRRPTSAVPDIDFLTRWQSEEEGMGGVGGGGDTKATTTAGIDAGNTTTTPTTTTSGTTTSGTNTGTNTTSSATSNPTPNPPAPNKTNGGLIFHCTAGKDRTGVLAAVILRLLRVDLDAICWEYAITEPGLGSWRDLFIERISQQGMGGPTRDQALKKPGAGAGQDEAKGEVESQGEDNEAKNGASPSQTQTQTQSQGSRLSKAEAARICSSRASNMRAFLTDVLDAEFGGPEKYLTTMVGLSTDEVGTMRELLVTEVSDRGEVVEWSGTRIEGWSLEEGMVGDRELEGA